MSKDIFDIHIGKQLRDAKAPVPSGAWSAIQSQIPPAPAGNLNFGFGLAAVVGGVMLIGLGSYSTVREPDNSGLITNISEGKVLQTEVLVEANTIPSEESKTTEFPVLETTTANQSVVSFESPAHMPVASAEITSPPSDQGMTQADPVPARSTILTQNNSGTQAAMPEGQSPDPVIVARKPVPSESASAKPSAKITTSAKKGYAPLEVTFENAGKADSHLWDFSSLGKAEGSTVTKIFEKPGIYEVTLTAFNAAGDTESKFVTIEVKEGSSLFMPSAVYPAGINKTYKVEGVNLKSFHLTVVNSTGKVIFETRNINDAWDVDVSAYGNQSEIYIAVVRAEGVDGVVYNQSKTLTIIQ